MYRIALSVGCLPLFFSSDPGPAFCPAKVPVFRKWQVTAKCLYCMKNNDEEVSPYTGYTDC
ncbi:hypothetical protein CF162_01960 [Parabacteroides distasonis]|nr:hypothetical protein CF162_01960 [Parabacteroides distasonis]